MAQQANPGLVERKVYFHRAWMGRDAQGNLMEADFETALAQIQRLIATPEWYQDINDESVLCLLPGGRVDGHLTAQFCIVRRAGLPQLEAAGQIVDLNLREDQGLLEPVYDLCNMLS